MMQVREAIPSLDAQKLAARDPETLAALGVAAGDVGFATVHNTALSEADVRTVLASYATFFARPEGEKRDVDMARTGANRGWGASGSEQVDPQANPDYKQVFDSGLSLAPNDPLAQMPVYAPNRWPAQMPEFKATVEGYYAAACDVAMVVLRALAEAIGAPRDSFDAAFAQPMALLRGNYYPARPDWATARDFGIAPHTDYGCLTLLATDGQPGLEVQMRSGAWVPVTAAPGTFVINFGEMMEMWTADRVKATPHRVIGTNAARLSVPLFFNPSHDTNVAPMGSGQVLRAGDHLARRFSETYVHLRNGGASWAVAGN